MYPAAVLYLNGRGMGGFQVGHDSGTQHVGVLAASQVLSVVEHVNSGVVGDADGAYTESLSLTYWGGWPRQRLARTGCFFWEYWPC